MSIENQSKAYTNKYDFPQTGLFLKINYKKINNTQQCKQNYSYKLYPAWPREKKGGSSGQKNLVLLQILKTLQWV